MKKLLHLLTLLLVVSLVTTSTAAPLILGQGYTAYIGESNYLFLEDPAGSAKVLRAAISNLISMDEKSLYCLTAEGRLYGIKLDGSGTEIVSANPTADELKRLAQVFPYTLEGQVLSVSAGSSKIEVAKNVTAVTANATNLYYMQTVDGKSSLFSASLTPTGGKIVPVRIGDGVASPLSMYATAKTLTVLHPDRTVTMVNLADNTITTAAATGDKTTAALYYNGNLIRYTADSKKNLTVESITADRTAVQPPTARTSGTNTSNTTGSSPSSPVGASTGTSGSAVTKPTAAPSTSTRVTTRTTSRPRFNGSSGGDDKIVKGSTGARVRKMQKRLSDLGYPVGSVDGKMGAVTLHALNLFQTALGVKERNYASSSLLKKLEASTAPAYDGFRPLNPGDHNAYVKQMQLRLIQLGYLQGEADGIYGYNTQVALISFQTAIKYPITMITGVADRDTLIRLYDLNAPTFGGGTLAPPPPGSYPIPPYQPPLPPFVATSTSMTP